MTSDQEFVSLMPEPAYGLKIELIRLTDMKKWLLYTVDMGSFAHFLNLSVFLLKRRFSTETFVSWCRSFIDGPLPVHLLSGGISFISYC